MVSEPIKNWYETNYKINDIQIVRNIPVHPSKGLGFKKTSKFRDEFNLDSEDIIFLYQGVLSQKRGVHELVSVFEQCDAKKHLVLMGYGPLEEFLISKAKIFKNIHFKPAVMPNEIIEYTSSADVGLFFSTAPLSLSYTYSLPNKFFEYAIGKLFIAVSKNFVVQSNQIKKWHLGTVLNSDIQSLKNFVNEISKEEINDCLNKCYSGKNHFCWSNNYSALLDLYQF